MLEDLVALDNEGSISLWNFGLPSLEDVAACHNFFCVLVGLIQMAFHCSVSANCILLLLYENWPCFQSTLFSISLTTLHMSLHSMKLLNNCIVFILDIALSPQPYFNVLHGFVLDSSCHAKSEMVIQLGDYWRMWKLRQKQTTLEWMIFMKSVQTEIHGTITEQNNLRVWVCAFTILTNSES